ncbi:MAG: hypothetical protein JXB15_09415 [Anaerolineales bacterium]|nr:hypothetical protein [Anaerolineales bacterium]
MSKHKKDPLLVALSEGRSYTWTVPDGGDMASMRAALKHGQTLTMSPITDPSEVQVGDMVLVKWGSSDIFHLVGDIQDGQYLIVNSLGKVNGWVGISEILGRVTEVVEPEPRPDVPELLEQLEASCRLLIQREQPAGEDAQRLLAVVDDLRWYADRIGAERWDVMPRSNRWSYQQNLWRLVKQARNPEAPDALRRMIDRGKRCVGLVSEIFALFEYGEAN